MVEMDAQTSVDDVHDGVDALVLSVFEAMRAAATPDLKAAVDTAEIERKLSSVCNTIDRLVGIDRTNAARKEVLQQTTADYQAARERTLELEERLRAMQASVSKRIGEIVDSPTSS